MYTLSMNSNLMIWTAAFYKFSKVGHNLKKGEITVDYRLNNSMSRCTLTLLNGYISNIILVKISVVTINDTH